MKLYKHLLLWTSLGTLSLLGWAAFEENTLQEWRVLQREYQSLLPAAEQSAFGVQLRQIVVPAFDASDRCVSCHLGMAPGQTPVEESRVFAAHPDVVHDPTTYGCVVCHGGQGRATERADAHGNVPHWPEPMIPYKYAYAGCGSCHTHLEVPNAAILARGKALFERYDCLACHSMDGRGGTLRPGGRGGMEGPDLSRVGATSYDERWYEGHLERRRLAGDAMPASLGAETEKLRIWRESFGPIGDADRDALRVLLASRVGAPGLVESKSLFHSLGCRGCHKLGGVGGDDGPDLTQEGQRDPGQLDFSHVPGERSLTAWFEEHFRAPASIVADSTMPALGLPEPQIAALTFYMFSLRRNEYPGAFWPADRIRAERFEEREFATDGATLYGTFCAACHGPSGEGMRYPGMAAFPAIGNPDFLERVDDTFLVEAIRRGRPGRRMPAWAAVEGGLRPAEIEAIVGFLRVMARVPEPLADERPRRWVEGDAGEGADIYAANCAGCHGFSGEGKEGTALANRVLLETASDTYLVETIRGGRRGTSMPGFGNPSPIRRLLEQQEIESVVAHIRGWEVQR